VSKRKRKSNSKTTTRQIETLSFPVQLTAEDKVEGKACNPRRCAYKLSGQRALYNLFPHEKHHHRVKVDASGIRFIHGGYRYVAPLPSKVKRNMIRFDGSLRCRKCKQLDEGFCPKHDFKPHQFTVDAVRERKVVKQKHSKKRQKQINVARRKRIAKRGPDQVYRLLHNRVVGLAP